MYKDIDKQKEAQRERTRRYRDKQKGVTSEGVTVKALHEQILTELANPAEHISQALARAKQQTDEQLLDDWQAGRGTAYQQRLATLSQQYSVLKGIDAPLEALT